MQTLSVPFLPKCLRLETKVLFTPPSVSLCSDQRLQGLRREHQQARADPGYEELDTARRRVLEHDPNRVSAMAQKVFWYKEISFKRELVCFLP